VYNGNRQTKNKKFNKPLKQPLKPTTMSAFGKKLLSAFVEVTESTKEAPELPAAKLTGSANSTAERTATAHDTSKFAQYFERLFSEANLPGPDYFEYMKMIQAMSSLANEEARYSAAFAGLSVQGLSKQKLLSSAQEYLTLLEKDAANFGSTINAALAEKVHGKKIEMEEKEARIQQLSNEIAQLNNSIAALEKEVTENEEKIKANSSGYYAEAENTKQKILHDIGRIEQSIAG
jgi:uncharacterized protein YoxC